MGAWLFGAALVLPRIGLAPPLRSFPTRVLAMTGGAHVVYGLTVALAFRLLSRYRR